MHFAKDHGALEYREYVSDDLILTGTRSFTDLVATTKGKAIVVFGWVVFESPEARILANEKMAANRRVANLIYSSNAEFDAERMVYGGFKSLVLSSNANTG